MKWNDDGLVAAIIQDADSGAVLMLGWMNAESFARTIESGTVWFWSRSRRALWMKGESSGNTLAVVEVRVDCDEDAVLVRAKPAGPTCHEGTTSCFSKVVAGAGGERSDDGPAGGALDSDHADHPVDHADHPVDHADHAIHPVDELASVVESRRGAKADSSYTAKLLSAGASAINAKIREEADELADAIEGESGERVTAEAADLIYHLLVGLALREIPAEAVWRELARRSGTSGLVEKANR